MFVQHLVPPQAFSTSIQNVNRSAYLEMINVNTL